MPIDLTIQTASPAPPGLADELADDLGIYPHVESGSGRTLAATAEVVVSVAVGAFFGSMVQQFGVRAADRLCQGFARLVNLASAKRKHSAARVLLIDEATGTRYALSPEVAANPKAMQALLELEHSAFPAGVTLRWDIQSMQWTATPPTEQTGET